MSEVDPLKGTGDENSSDADSRPSTQIVDLETALGTARAIVAGRFPLATAAYLAGSWPAGRASVTSDLDIVAVITGPPAPFRETIRVGPTPVELFVHTNDSLTDWYGREKSEGRCTLAHMVATGVPLSGGDVEIIQNRARDWVASGPDPWTTEMLDHRRYALTDALDDLRGADDPGERDVVAGQIQVMTAELALNIRRAWLGRGKWLVRQLRATDPSLCEQLLAAHREAVATGHVESLISVCEGVLDEVGGRLTEGYVA